MNDLVNKMQSFYSSILVKPILLYHSKKSKFENLKSFYLENQILVPLYSCYFLNTWNNFKNIFYFMDVNEDIHIIKNNNLYTLEINNEKIRKNIYDFRHCLFLIQNDHIFNISVNNIRVKNIIDIFNHCNLNLWNEKEEYSFIVHQKGAGNGKTYGIWKSILLNTTHKTFIIVTKQHTAKNVIYQELISQLNNKEKHTFDITNIHYENTEKHYVIKFKKYNQEFEYIVFIGTIDSFVFNLTEHDKSSNDIFKTILFDIKNNGCKKIMDGKIKYANQHLELNSSTELWIDEVQDLSPDYLFAVMSLIQETNIKVHAVGDILQSLEYDNNFLSCSKNIENVKMTNPENINRRIKTKNMNIQINNIIHFDKYNVPPIAIQHELFDYKKSFQIIEAPIIYNNDDNEVKIMDYVDKLLYYVDVEVCEHHYVPSDFLFIFPIMKNNILAIELETKLNHYWLSKFEDIHYVNKLNDFWKKHILNKFNQYVYLHKYQEGTTINTSESIHSTRIMSIRSSKGDGRKITFVLNCTEASLKLLSHGEINLIYESYLHVAITRANHKIYFALLENNDDIHKRFGQIGMIQYKPIIKKTIYIEDILKFIEKDNLNFNFNEVKVKQILTENKNELYNHSIYNCCCILSILNINQVHNQYSQIKTVLDKIKGLSIQILSPKSFYQFINKYSSPMEEFPFLPLCNLSHKELYQTYCKIIYDTIKKVQKNIYPKTIYECFILNYIISLYTYKQYNRITPTELYNFTHYFYNHRDKNIHYEPIQNNCNDFFETLHEYYDNITWNINKMIEYKGNDTFKFRKNNFSLIGYNDSYVFHILLKDDINSLNYSDILLEILLEKMIISNPKENEHIMNDKKRYYGKKIKTYVLNMKNHNYIKIEGDHNIKHELIQSVIKYYKEKTSDLFQYMRQIIDQKFNGNINQDSFKYILSQIVNYPSYMIDFFEDLKDKNNVHSIISDYHLFKTLLEDKLVSYCELFFNFD